MASFLPRPLNHRQEIRWVGGGIADGPDVNSAPSSCGFAGVPRIVECVIKAPLEENAASTIAPTAPTWLVWCLIPKRHSRRAARQGNGCPDKAGRPCEIHPRSYPRLKLDWAGPGCGPGALARRNRGRAAAAGCRRHSAPDVRGCGILAAACGNAGDGVPEESPGARRQDGACPQRSATDERRSPVAFMGQHEGPRLFSRPTAWLTPHRPQRVCSSLAPRWTRKSLAAAHQPWARHHTREERLSSMRRETRRAEWSRRPWWPRCR